MLVSYVQALRAWHRRGRGLSAPGQVCDVVDSIKAQPKAACRHRAGLNPCLAVHPARAHQTHGMPTPKLHMADPYFGSLHSPAPQNHVCCTCGCGAAQLAVLANAGDGLEVLGGELRIVVAVQPRALPPGHRWRCMHIHPGSAREEPMDLSCTTWKQVQTSTLARRAADAKQPLPSHLAQQQVQE